ncbi:Chloroperoxidase [Cantharellus anzutake]|uniref:Chloroperoxidase n=1 Tax=Cantharellus anzutake TaxID=1750568 RepID=UPI0019064A01|nr:Chloroperoxidase [Cantharellus anzutake]KAF8327877.1 Chloroperoxidase [Cantharellus anzutake]
MSGIYNTFWGKDPYNHEYRAPGPNDLRSPCPFLNTLANHGYVNRSGRYVTLISATLAIREVYNFTLITSFIVALAGWFTGLTQGWNPFWFDLKQQRIHKSYLIEHDASLTRGNWPENNWEPNQQLFEALISKASSPDGLSHEDFAHHRIDQEKKLSYTLSQPRHILATGEVGLIIPALGRGSDEPKERRISLDWARSFFLHARLPDDWKRIDKTIPWSVVNGVAGVVRDDMKKIRDGEKTK